jgi:signal transduction histidine kinase
MQVTSVSGSMMPCNEQDILQLSHMLAAFGGVRDIESLIELMANEVWAAINYRQCTIAVCDGDRRVAQMWSLSGQGRFQTVPTEVEPLVAAALGESLETRRLAVIEDRGRCAICAPVGGSNARLLGVVCIELLGRYQHQDSVWVLLLAELIGTAMRRFASDSIASRLASSTGELKELERKRDTFLGMLGHDLRNPLSSIVMCAHLMKNRAIDEETIRATDRILNSAQRMGLMIDHMLAFASARVGPGIPIRPTPVDLRHLCQRIIAELEPVSTGMLKLEMFGDLLGVWDADRVEQVVSNLVGNAIQHGVPRTRVAVRVDGTCSERVVLSVENEGVIPPSLLPTVFEPFSRARDDHGRQGLGLGLYITLEIVEAHGGTVRVKSSEADGTIFTVELPRDSGH